MPKVYLIEAHGPFTVAKERCTKPSAVRMGLRDAVLRAAERQDMTRDKACTKALVAVSGFRRKGGEDRFLEVRVGNYTITARRA
jgi:hypothetical protein